MAKYEKVYVAMYLQIDEDGKTKPVALEWTDGTRFNIDRIIDERTAPPIYTGGTFTRKYKVRIRGRDKVIYFDMLSKRWFVEKPTG